MDNPTSVVLSRLTAQQRALDVTAVNIANADTGGYKSERVLFADWLQRQSVGAAPPGGTTIAYTQDRATYHDQQEGGLTHTANPLDIAITGQGFFTVDTPRGPRLTRAGRFQLMPDGTVSNSNGDALLDTNGRRMQLSPADTQISVAGDGTISSENGQLGKIGVVQLDDPMQLQAEGAQLFRLNGASTPVPAPKLLQGALEKSNVQLLLETTRMMNDLREFQFASEFLQGESDRRQGAVRQDPDAALVAAHQPLSSRYRTGALHAFARHRRHRDAGAADQRGGHSNNIANMTTTGFKRRRAEFQDLIYQNLRRVGSNSSDTGTIVPAGAQVGLGVKTAAIYRIGEQGNLQQTSNSLDVAVQGNGFFQVTLPSGDIAYTRDGTFSLSPDGTIVTADGYVVQPGLTIPSNAKSITINAAGQVQVALDRQTAPQTVGQIQLAVFPNDAGLDAQGDNLFLQTAASGNAVTGVPASTGFGTVMQGFVETSNVNVVTEITNLITAQRAYEMNSKVITTSDQMLSTLTNLR